MSKTPPLKVITLALSIQIDCSEVRLIDFRANSSKNFINLVKNPWKCKKIYTCDSGRESQWTLLSFWTKENSQKSFLKPMWRRMFSTHLTGNSANVPGQHSTSQFSACLADSRQTFQLFLRKNSSRFVISLATKIFAKHGIKIVTYYQVFKYQGS